MTAQESQSPALQGMPASITRNIGSFAVATLEEVARLWFLMSKLNGRALAAALLSGSESVSIAPSFYDAHAEKPEACRILRVLAQPLSNCRLLSMSGCTRATWETVSVAAAQLPRLRRLDLSGCVRLRRSTFTEV